MIAQETSRRTSATPDPSNQVNGKRRHAKRVWSDYYTGDETTRTKSEANGDAEVHSRKHNLETPRRARSPGRNGAPMSAPAALNDTKSGGNPYAKAYGKDAKGKASTRKDSNGSHSKAHGRPRGGSSSTAHSAADQLAANTRALVDKEDEPLDTEHQAGESFWRSLVPCFRLICPEDAKALKERGTDPSKDPMFRKHNLGAHWSMRWMVEDTIDLEGLAEHLGEDSPLTAEQLSEGALSSLIKVPEARASAPKQQSAQDTQVSQESNPEVDVEAAAQKDEIMEELTLLQQQLHTTVTCNDASRNRLRKCATAAMQRQQLLWRKWRYWYEVDRHYRWRQRMSQVHKLIIKNRNNKRDTRKAAERCVVSDFNHVDKHLAEYAHGWRPEQRITELGDDLDLGVVDQMHQTLKDREEVSPALTARLALAQEATGKDFGLVRQHLHNTLEILVNTLHRELVKKDLVGMEMQSLDLRVEAASNAVMARQQQRSNSNREDDELCVQVGGLNRSGSKQSVLKPGQARPGHARAGQASVVKPGQPRPGLPSVSKPGQPRPGLHKVERHDPLKPCESLQHMEALVVGDKVDCMDCENRWGRAVVQQVYEDGVLIHWEGFKKSLDEKILFVEHLRCTKPGVHVQVGGTGDKPKKTHKRARSSVSEGDLAQEDTPLRAKVLKTEALEDEGDGSGRSRRNCSSIYRRS